MEDIQNQIYKLALSYCKDSQANTPEEMLFGLVKLSSLSDMALGYLLKDKGIEDTDAIRKSVEDIKTALDKRKLDPNLIKEGLGQLLPLIEQTRSHEDGFKTVLSSFDEKTSVDTIVNDVVSAMDPEELKVFSVGNDIKDVNEYQNTLHNKLSDNKNTVKDTADKKEIEKQPEPEKADNSGDRDRKSAKKTDEIEIFSEKLSNYLEKLRTVAPALVQADNQELLWRQSLIVSIDDGFGFSTFAKQIESIFRENDLIGKDDGSIITEMKVTFEDRPEHYFEKILFEVEKKISNFGEVTNKKKLYQILAIDLGAVCGKINDPKFRDFIKYVEFNGDAVFILFRLPYLERNVVSDISAAITDIMPAEVIIVPPISIPLMIDYMHKRAKTYGYSLDKGCDEYLEQGIIAEKNDGRFYGFRTLNKIVDTIIYKIAWDSGSNKKNSSKITANQLKKYIDLTDCVSDSEQTLKNMVGVESIIDQIDKAINQVKVSLELCNKGKDVERPSIHMMFRGNPGTGKTTIARVVAAKMKEAGILKKGSFFEIKGRDLCAEYVGQTTPKTCQICRDAYGSVLFVDEAYELYQGGDSGRDYGPEALAALVAEMENHRDDMCVIFAGYTDEMNTMVTGNPGLRSRIPIVIDFPNYTKAQLEDIFFKMMEDKFEYEPGVKKCAHEFFDSLSEDVLSSKEFSNARFVRNLFESVWGEAALRYDLSENDKLMIKESDFRTAADKADLKSMVEKKMRPIGFVV